MSPATCAPLEPISANSSSVCSPPRQLKGLACTFTGGRIAVAESFLREDTAVEDHNYSLLYQLTYITRDRGALAHDDRIDAVAGAVEHFQRAMMMDVDQAAQTIKEAEIEDFRKASINPPTAVCGLMVSGSLRGPQTTGGPGTAGRMPSGSINYAWGLTKARPCPTCHSS